MIPNLRRGAERPGLAVFWSDTLGDPVDLSGGYTFVVSITQDGTASTLTASVTANASPTNDRGLSNDVPTLDIAFAAGALDNLSAGPGVLKIVATKAGLNRDNECRVLVG
jgi:hypothetical protein